MNPKLKLLIDGGHKELAQQLYMHERLVFRVKEANLDPTNPEWDLNPYLNLVRVADQVVSDLHAEGFNDANREEVYLTWLNEKIYHASEFHHATKQDDTDMSDLPMDDEDYRLANGR